MFNNIFGPVVQKFGYFITIPLIGAAGLYVEYFVSEIGMERIFNFFFCKSLFSNQFEKMFIFNVDGIISMYVNHSNDLQKDQNNSVKMSDIMIFFSSKYSMYMKSNKL